MVDIGWIDGGEDVHAGEPGTLEQQSAVVPVSQIFSPLYHVRFEGEKIRMVAGQVSGVQGSSSWSSHGYLLQKILVFSWVGRRLIIR